MRHHHLSIWLSPRVSGDPCLVVRAVDDLHLQASYDGGHIHQIHLELGPVLTAGQWLARHRAARHRLAAAAAAAATVLVGVPPCTRGRGVAEEQRSQRERRRPGAGAAADVRLDELAELLLAQRAPHLHGYFMIRTEAVAEIPLRVLPISSSVLITNATSAPRTVTSNCTSLRRMMPMRCSLPSRIFWVSHSPTISGE
jgi:hypothetical protein